MSELEAAKLADTACTITRPPPQRQRATAQPTLQQEVNSHTQRTSHTVCSALRESTHVVSVVWPTSVSVTEETTWRELKDLICIKTAVSDYDQRLTPSGEDGSAACGLGDGDEVMCEWKLPYGEHPLHRAGE